MQITKKQYGAPLTRLVPMRFEHDLCKSPEPGESEEISFEEWFWGEKH